MQLIFTLGTTLALLLTKRNAEIFWWEIMVLLAKCSLIDLKNYFLPKLSNVSREWAQDDLKSNLWKNNPHTLEPFRHIMNITDNSRRVKPNVGKFLFFSFYKLADGFVNICSPKEALCLFIQVKCKAKTWSCYV